MSVQNRIFSTPLTILPYYKHVELCVFTGLGCHWMLKDGLFCNGGGEDKIHKVIKYRQEC